MNANLLAIVKQIIAAEGEEILADPQRLKPFISNLARNEPKPERVAFGRCITAGAYRELKKAGTAAERRNIKPLLARRIQTASTDAASFDEAACNAALDLLEAAIFGTRSVQAPPSIPARKISKKTALFGIAAGAGALAGFLVSVIFGDNHPMSGWDSIIEMAVMGLYMGLGISTGLLIVQAFSVKKKPRFGQVIKTLLTGGISGLISAGFAQFIFSYTQTISDPVRMISNALCWGIAGMGIGLAAAFYVPNYPPKRAMLAGAAGGTTGGIIYIVMSGFISGLGSIIGVIILGFIIGLAISVIEEAFREAWLTIVWSKNETATVSLGRKTVIFGSTPEADIFIPKPRDQPQYPPLRALVWIENGRIIMEDRLTNRRAVLQNGSQVDLGKLRFIVTAKTK